MYIGGLVGSYRVMFDNILRHARNAEITIQVVHSSMRCPWVINRTHTVAGDVRDESIIPCNEADRSTGNHDCKYY